MPQATDRVSVGRIAGVFGVRGELKCDPTSAGRTVFSPGAELRCKRGSDVSIVRILSARPHGSRLIIRIEGADDVVAAGTYAGADLYASRDSIVLEAGEYLDEDLIGCAVQGSDGTRYGTVERVEHYPASDMLIVDGRMVPMVRPIVVTIDLGSRQIVIDPPAGLLE